MRLGKLISGIVLFSALGMLFLYMAGFFTEKLPQDRVVRLADLQDAETLLLKSQSSNVERGYTGSVVADQAALLSARLTAKVAEVLVDVGDVVRQGDVLMRLESRDLDARVRQTEEGLSSAQARLNAARKEYNRVKELVGRKLLPQAEFDRVESELRTAQANFRQAGAAVAEAETTFGYSVITAPFDGVITRRPVNRGDTAIPGTELISMYNPQTLQLEANVAESQISGLAPGSVLKYVLPTNQLEGMGQIEEISPAADNNSRSFIVKLGLRDLQNKVYPGAYGKIIITVDQRDTLVLPASAVYQVGQLDYVKVVENGEVRRRLVQLGRDNRVRKGVAEGDTVLLQPLNY